MSRTARSSPAVRRVRTAVAAAVVLGGIAAGGLAVPTSVAGAATTSSPTVTLTLPTALHHGYRHGAVPRHTRDVAGVDGLRRATSQAPRLAARSSARLLTYGGGLTAGGLTAAGVTTGKPKLYLVFMGGQWGTESTDGAGRATFTGDPDSLAPALQTLYAGLGTDSETWSGVLTQYCDGAPVGASSCAQGATQIPHPIGGVLSGVWYDSSTQATAQETAGLSGHQLAVEAEAAAVHFANADQASNRDTQYVIVSPTGTDPDGWANPRTGYCAYHDDTHDPTIAGGPATGTILAFTNMPYVPDAGFSCGEGQVNSPGVLDGATTAASHEYAETVTDQFPESTPAGGWSNASGAEDGDLCAYVAAPAVGPAFNLVLATGTVAVQGTWSNRANGGKGACSDGEADFAYVPSVASVSPASAAAGVHVTVDGANLGGVTSVTFAGTPATVLVDTSTALTVVVPAGAADGVVTVVSPLGTASSTTTFHLAPSISGFTSSVARGGSVTITGSGLGTAKKVTIGGRRAVVTSLSPNQIIATVSKRATTGTVSVTSKYGTATGAGTITIT
jgi:IPT/TIG domain